MWYFKLVILPALLTSVTSEFPIETPLDYEPLISRSDDSNSYRLPEDLDPIHYEVEIMPYFEAEEGKEAFTFDGIVTILFRAVSENVNQLVIQENVREILQISVLDENNQPVDLNVTVPFERLREFHFLKINLRDGVTLRQNATYILRILYIGNINETPLSRGIFRGFYKDANGQTHWYAASHLQPVNSRQAFPSFDEPGFKSTFDIIVNRPAHFGPSYSNMKISREEVNGNRVREIFQTTPRMSAYLVTVHISEEFKVIADNNNSTHSYRIIARPNAEGQGEYALEIGPPITKWLEDYFGIDYYTMEEELKNDQIAVPDWASGATENWGLVSYRELRLLYEEGETNAVDKMSIGTITAHELAHKWFGNLITCRWWDNVWINEGFASYFEYFAMDGVDKTMELEDQFNIMYVQSALSSDSSANTRALQHAVNSPAEVTGHFSGISYSKGAALLLMLKHFVTEDTFKKALNTFLLDKSYEHAFPEDIYRAFGSAVQGQESFPSDINIETFFKTWVDEPGYPVINVEVNQETGLMSLRQERFFISETATQTDQIWPVPLTFTTSQNPNWENLTPTHVMTERTMDIQDSSAVNSWVIFNVQQKGIYRVNYDAQNWQLIAAALKEDISSIHHLNRAQIVDDVFALMRSKRITFNFGFQILDFLKQDTSYYSWYPAITGFNWLRNRLLHLPEKLEEFDQILYNYLDAVITDLGYDVVDNEPLTRTLNRFYIMNFACNIGHEGCLNDAVAKYSALRNDGTSVNPNLRRHVFCKGVHEGTYEDWSFLNQRRLNSNNQADMAAMLRALGCTINEAAVQEYLENILDADVVKAQDRVNAFTFLYMGDRSNANRALQFLKQRINDVRTAMVLQSWFDSIISNLAGYLNEEGLEDMEQWLRENQGSIPEYSLGISAINSARASMEWGSQNADAILDAARDSAVIAVPTTMLLLTSLIALYFQ